MKKIIKPAVGLLLCTAMLLALLGCSKSAHVDLNLQTIKPEDEIKVEGSVKFTCPISTLVEQQAADAVINAFQDAYPDASVIKDYNPGNIAARIASGEIGDVFWFTGPETYNYAVTQQCLLSLNQFIEPLHIDLSKVFTGILQIGMVEGQLYMVPKDYNHIVMLYNRTALREAGLNDPESGWSWDTFKDYCTQTTKTDPNDPSHFTQIGSKFQLGWAPCYIPVLEGWGGTWVDTENKFVSMTDDKVLAGIEEVLSFSNTGAMYKEYWNSNGAYDNLNSLSYVFTAVCYPMVQALATAYDEAGIDWDFCDFPAFPKHVVGTGCNGFAVYRYTRNPNAAAALALFFFSKEGQFAYHSNAGGSVPLVKELAEDDFWRGHGATKEGCDWSVKNYDAFISYPEADINGEVNCRMPIKVAKVVGDGWQGVLSSYYNEGTYMDQLIYIETKANETWQSILRTLGS